MIISRRNLIAVILMMGVLFLLIQISLVLKEQENEFTENDHYKTVEWNALSEFQTTVVSSSDDTPERDYVVYIGSENTKVFRVVKTWCTYRKMDLMVEPEPKKYRRDLSHYPKAIIINGEELDIKSNLSVIALWEGGTVPLIFATLPPVREVRSNKRFMSLIGVDYMMPVDAVKEELVGYHVLGGFLLGGDTFYQPVTRTDKKRMDLNLDIPRYHVFNNTKSYIIGMYDKTPKNTELQPSLLWRYTSKGANVFVVNGDFLKDLSGVGYLSAIMAQIREYDIYPVVNAQEFSLVDFPGLSNENTDRMLRRYSRDQSNFYKDLVWPGMVSVMEESGYVPTCYMAPQMDYTRRGNTPLASELYYYLKQVKEKRGELGISMHLLRGSELEDKIKKDQEYIFSSSLSYRFGALYVPGGELEGVMKQLSLAEEDSYLGDVRTVVTDSRERVLGYGSLNVTLQGITGKLNPYYYSEDLKNKGYETALGYANAAFEMSDLIWSEKDGDQWQKVSKIVAANLGTYWKKYDCFDRVTASEADRRIRSFLAMDYHWSSFGDNLNLEIKNFHGKVWFIVRLREGEVKSVEGGAYQKVEDGIYLIRAERDSLQIRVGEESRAKNFVR